MRPSVPDPAVVEAKVRTFKKHLDAIVRARVCMYEAALLGKPVDLWVGRIHALEVELAIGWPTPPEFVHREQYYENLTRDFKK
jgi:hypothetical protein